MFFGTRGSNPHQRRGFIIMETLSDKIFENQFNGVCEDLLHKGDVKEFIHQLKEKLNCNGMDIGVDWMAEVINKLAGEKLT